MSQKLPSSIVLITLIVRAYTFLGRSSLRAQIRPSFRQQSVRRSIPGIVPVFHAFLRIMTLLLWGEEEIVVPQGPMECLGPWIAKVSWITSSQKVRAQIEPSTTNLDIRRTRIFIESREETKLIAVSRLKKIGGSKSKFNFAGSLWKPLLTLQGGVETFKLKLCPGFRSGYFIIRRRRKNIFEMKSNSLKNFRSCPTNPVSPSLVFLCPSYQAAFPSTHKTILRQ